MRRFLCIVNVIPVLLWGWGDDLARQNRNTIATLQQRLEAQQERIDGLTSVIEGLNETLGDLQRQVLETRRTQNSALVARIEALEKRLDTMASELHSCKQTNRQNAIAGKTDNSTKSVKTSASKRYAQAVRAYKKHAYASAKSLFTQLANEGYKPAASNFYLGEIAYYTKRYKDAIYYYKTSADLYDKAGYMDVLMLHTAVSLEKTGQKEQAKAFYQALIEKYGGRKSAQIAKKRLVRLH